MEKKSISATILVLFLAITFSVIGICFNVFVYEETKIIIKNVDISGDVNAFSDKNLSKKATKLSLSKMDLGLKPATGELDTETQIPSTINDKGTSEGYYATIFVPSGDDIRVVIKNIVVETKKNQAEADEERKNIFVAIKDISGANKSLEDDEIQLATLKNITETQKLTFFIWLSSFAGENLVGAKISFEISLESIKN